MLKVLILAALVATLPMAVAYKLFRMLTPMGQKRARLIIGWSLFVSAWLALLLFIISRN